MLNEGSQLLKMIHCRISFYKVLKKANCTVVIRDSDLVVKG